MKGLELETIVGIIIALVSITLLIIFASGPLSDLGRNVYCFFYEKVLHETRKECKDIGVIGEFVKINTTRSEEIARIIAAYSILCYNKAKFESKLQTIPCYTLEIENRPTEAIAEIDIAEIMKKEGGCDLLENSIVKDKYGIEKSFDCGDEDNLIWNVSGNVIFDQKIVLIMFDRALNKIIVS
ncbi:MAG: hypothetical protein QXG39_09615 [Candidatus Aenigmatarchaeota archaeon]